MKARPVGKSASKQRPRKAPLTVTDPYIADTWHPEKNGSLKPEDVTRGSNRKAWWNCSDDASHEWQSMICNRVRQPGCPVCLGKLVIPTTSLLGQCPEVAQEWHPTKNNGRSPAEYSPHSSKIAWWRCQNNPEHEWSAAISSRTRKKAASCPYCNGHSVDGHNSLAKQYPLIAAQWHPTRNGRIKPDMVRPQSNEKFWFICEHGHEHLAAVYSKTHGGSGCPVCAGKRVTNANSLACLCPEIASDWDPDNLLNPDQVSRGSAKVVGWICELNPNHKWVAPVYSRTTGGNGCPFCANQRVTSDNCLLVTHPELADEWHTERNGDLTPERITAGYTKSIYWKCSRNSKHIWKAPPINRKGTVKRPGTGCPHCSNQVSKEACALFERLRESEPDLITEQSGDAQKLKLPGMRSSYDALIPSLKLFIEYDGWYWHKDKYEEDVKKTQHALDHGYLVMRIRQGNLPHITRNDIRTPRVFNLERDLESVIVGINRLKETEGVSRADFVSFPSSRRFESRVNF
ncbi:MAG: zinc-ribbon domain-containing protein [Thiogranum sp.]|nr:zinc-ribbon domain-containing protein [Thiogranum sp.]